MVTERGLAEWDEDGERITTTVMSFLGLLGLDADPVRSRDHILFSTLMDTAWRAGSRTMRGSRTV